MRQEYDLDVEWLPFELRPEPVPTLDPQGEYLRVTWERSVYPLAARLGVEIKLPPVQPRTRLAHEAFEYARRHGRPAEMADALFRAFFQQGRDIGRLDVLVAVGQEAGVDPEGLRESLEKRLLKREVDALLAKGLELGIRAVPTFFIGPYRIEGLLDADALRRVLAKAGAKAKGSFSSSL